MSSLSYKQTEEFETTVLGKPAAVVADLIVNSDCVEVEKLTVYVEDDSGEDRDVAPAMTPADIAALEAEAIDRAGKRDFEYRSWLRSGGRD